MANRKSAFSDVVMSGQLWFRVALCMLIVLVFAAEPLKNPPQNPDKDKMDKALEGRWEIHSMIIDGKSLMFPEGGEAGFITFSGTKVTFSGVKEGTFKVDPSKDPKQIDVTFGSKTEPWIYEAKGDILKIAKPIKMITLSEGKAEEKPLKRPTGFEGKDVDVSTYKKKTTKK